MNKILKTISDRQKYNMYTVFVYGVNIEVNCGKFVFDCIDVTYISTILRHG